MSDALTQLPDREEFRHELLAIIQRASGTDTTLALFIVKLQHLHEVNATFGYASGDALLAESALRIQSMLRAQDRLYRIGDSTFALVLPNLRNEGIATLAVNKLLTLLDAPVVVADHQMKSNVKVGIALWPHHTDDAVCLSQYADMALESALDSTEPFHIFSAGQSETKSGLIALEPEMHTALENDEFLMLYQPQIDLKSRAISGMEALIRWQSPRRGMVPPDHFMPLLERSPLILPVTLWTLNTAMRQCDELSKKGLDIPVSINLSAAVLHTPNLAQHIQSAMNIWNIAPKKLVLEVTESALMDKPEHSLQTLQSLHAVGIALSIDDFGTGYSSLSYLSRLPVDELKVDKSFVINMMENSNDLKIVNSIIELAHNFGLTVIAEGIEDNATLQRLVDLGCDRGQGYYFGRPQPIDELLHLATTDAATP